MFGTAQYYFHSEKVCYEIVLATVYGCDISIVVCFQRHFHESNYLNHL